MVGIGQNELIIGGLFLLLFNWPWLIIFWPITLTVVFGVLAIAVIYSELTREDPGCDVCDNFDENEAA